jgi:crotonobetaine/carnitine-CoA ligase
VTRGLRGFLDARCAAAGEAAFLLFRGRTWSYAELGVITDGAASALLRLGLRRGDRVAMLLPNCPELVLAWLALAKIGVLTAPLHPQLAPEEVDRMLAHLRPAGFIVDPALCARPVTLPAGCGRVIERGATLDEILATRETLTGVDAPGPDDPSDILMTSGTTGLPKGVVQTHRTSVITGEAFAGWLGLNKDDRLFTCLPFSHINARAYSTMGALAAGASLAIEERFSASRFWHWMSDTGATEVNAIGAMLQILLNAPPATEDRGHRLRLVYSAPAIGERAHLEFERRFGARLVIGYGLTESTFGFIHPLAGERRLHAMGRPRCHPDPALGNEVRLVDEAGNDAEQGEIWLRNAAVFSGYFEDETATRQTLTPDGWLRTGDLARREPGDWYTFIARLKEIIRRRGENIAPAEVESVLMACPGVAEAAVVGVASDLGEEEVAAFVVLEAGSTLTQEELRAFAAGRLAPFKLPTLWRFPGSLPRTATQRVARHLLKPD